MKTKWLSIGISILAVILLTLTSISNVVGYQSVQTSQQNIIKERINQRELLFQTIIDIANNKEIQRIILKAQMSRGIFPTSEIPVITKNQIRQMYLLGLILSKFISKSRIQSMVGRYQFDNQKIQQEISNVVEKDKTLKTEISQLKDTDCDCGNDYSTSGKFSIICIFLFFIWVVAANIWMLFLWINIFKEIVFEINALGGKLNCFWYQYINKIQMER